MHPRVWGFEQKQSDVNLPCFVLKELAFKNLLCTIACCGLHLCIKGAEDSKGGVENGPAASSSGSVLCGGPGRDSRTSKSFREYHRLLESWRRRHVPNNQYIRVGFSCTWSTYGASLSYQHKHWDQMCKPMPSEALETPRPEVRLGGEGERAHTLIVVPTTAASGRLCFTRLYLSRCWSSVK